VVRRLPLRVTCSWLDPVFRFLVSSFFVNDPATTEIYTLSLHDALPISETKSTSMPLPCIHVSFGVSHLWVDNFISPPFESSVVRSEEHTSELQSRENLVCRLLLEKKKNKHSNNV